MIPAVGEGEDRCIEHARVSGHLMWIGCRDGTLCAVDLECDVSTPVIAKSPTVPQELTTSAVSALEVCPSQMQMWSARKNGFLQVCVCVYVCARLCMCASACIQIYYHTISFSFFLFFSSDLSLSLMMQVWRGCLVSGAQMAEGLRFHGEVTVEGKGVIKLKSDRTLTLRHAELLLSKGDHFKTIHVSTIQNVSAKESEVRCLLSDGVEFKFLSPSASEWVSQIQQCVEYLHTSWAFEMLGCQKTSAKNDVATNAILALKELNGAVWSANARFTLIEWSLQRDQTGLEGGRRWVMVRLRRVALRKRFESLPQTLTCRLLTCPSPLKAVFGVEVWCISPWGAVVMSVGARREDIVSEELLMSDGGLKGDTWVCCAIAILRRKVSEVWVGERCGCVRIWDTPGRKCLGKLDLEGILTEGQFVTYMADIDGKVMYSDLTVASFSSSLSFLFTTSPCAFFSTLPQVWCGTNLGAVFQISVVTKRVISNTFCSSAHTKDVVSFLSDEKGNVFSVSCDASVAQWVSCDD